MNFVIRKAVMADIDDVEKIYNDVLDYEANNICYTNWKKGLYPTRMDAETAINHGTLYVGVENNVMVGCAILNHIQLKEYSKLNWNFRANGNEVMVIHTLCIDPMFSKRGFGKKFVDFSEQTAKKLRCKTVRLDTYEGNIPAASLYCKLGYRYVGSVEVNFQNVIMETLKCFEKSL
ncbi:GNAT family N-acetyltransferase [Clostridiaceae bacterium UIB06]|uniref:GNAT family N-acetyltransferase n=1 Tax=Clostridium thailandense TaxID=2794346 RepID=A0A949TJT7_9CLOT|nr:GNAT family N-acetyltransferase [Clostridium thailandense]MBV7271832.1 GNAT family N-acetyltransferase [Clostridium thailandense]MCH5135628.1 GNAT family N-acetyltransferase [Clostridiaceae bacterium UIB06]